MGIENVWSALYSTTDRLSTGRMVAWRRELLQCQGYVAGRAQAGDHHQHLCDQPEWLLVWSSRQEHGVITNWAELWSNTHLSVANFQEFTDVQGWQKIFSPLSQRLWHPLCPSSISSTLPCFESWGHSFLSHISFRLLVNVTSSISLSTYLKSSDQSTIVYPTFPISFLTLF